LNIEPQRFRDSVRIRFDSKLRFGSIFGQIRSEILTGKYSEITLEQVFETLVLMS
jgi:hypothetical protein